MYTRLKYLILCAITFTNIQANAQASKPVTWSFSVKKTADKEFDLVFKALIKQGIHMYSQHIGDGGPIPTSFQFDKNPDITIVDSVIEKSNVIKVHDKMFDMDLVYFEDSAIFVQHVRLTSPADTVTGKLEFMACDKTKCYPPSKLDFIFALPK